MNFTIVIQIGNSDDKLTQKEWADFCIDMYQLATRYCIQIHFFGSPDAKSTWQNACLVADCGSNQFDELKYRLRQLAGKYKQESIALSFGDTQFIRPLNGKGGTS